VWTSKPTSRARWGRRRTEPGSWQRAATGADLFVHTAAVVSNAVDAETTWRVNLLGTRRAVHAAHDGAAGRFVHFSSVRAFSDRHYPDGADETWPPRADGNPYTKVVCALQGLAQYDVAEEWAEAMERWCRTSAIGSLHGRCRVHRAEILRLVARAGRQRRRPSERAAWRSRCAFALGHHEGVERDVADLVDDEQLDALQAGDLVVEAAVALGVGQERDPFGGRLEGDAVAGQAGADADRDREMTFPGPRGARAGQDSRGRRGRRAGRGAARSRRIDA
jgi:hypothetical protein